MEVIRTYRIVEAALIVMGWGEANPAKARRAPPAETAEGSERSPRARTAV